MTRKRIGLVAVLVTAAAGCGGEVRENDALSTMGTNAEVGQVLLRNVYVQRPEDGGYEPGDSATIRLSLFNKAREDDALVGVTSPVARAVVPRWDKECDGDAERVEAITVLAEGTVPGTPGTGETGHLPYYLALDQVTQTVRPGTTIPVTFTFTRAGNVTVDVLVQPQGTADVPAPLACQGTTEPAAPTTGPAGG
ncbi:copper chaperone PCu(A)C [Actinokineospora iranica]|uniref:Copper(I)-binding protein n=1 Tax=Actinokineospora iranica TaxID=1271860 RepID=A0A1G6U5J4_9PSEU|nr:copper chaperone PCu(A)C [Actinokineospora iranica]SDD35857.1 hypothetical protein SAMN05216174_11087 [Actinokineospora iranica]